MGTGRTRTGLLGKPAMRFSPFGGNGPSALGGGPRILDDDGPRILGGGCPYSSGCPDLGSAQRIDGSPRGSRSRRRLSGRKKLPRPHLRLDGAFNISVAPCARGDRRKHGIGHQSTVVRNYE